MKTYYDEPEIFDMNKSFVFDNPNVIVMQYTGLKDKNGKEIYEGDLVSHISRNGRKPHPIIYSNGAFCGDYGLIYPLFHEHFDKYCEIEIIGNIYENPDLIKGE